MESYEVEIDGKVGPSELGRGEGSRRVAGG